MAVNQDTNCSIERKNGKREPLYARKVEMKEKTVTERPSQDPKHRYERENGNREAFSSLEASLCKQER